MKIITSIKTTDEYQYLELNFENQVETFKSGDFCTDWYLALKYFYHNFGKNDTMMNDESFNNFVHRNELFESRFVYFDNRKLETISRHPNEGQSQEIFVPKGFSGGWNDYKATLKL